MEERIYAAVETLKDALEGRIAEDGWRRASKTLGKQREELARMVEAFDLDVDIRNFPRIYQQIDHQPRRMPDTRQERGIMRLFEGET